MPSSAKNVVLKQLTLTRVRCYEDFKLKFTTRPRKNGQWTILLGDNGVGKSTILKSLAIALSPLRDLTRYPEGRLQRLDAKPGEVHLIHSQGEERFETGSASREFGFPPTLFAYGAARGNALGGPERSVDLTHPMGPLSTLFGQPPGLIHAETWLRNLAFAAARDPHGLAGLFFNAVCATLLGLLPGVESLDVEPDAVWLHGPAIGRAPLTGLSDGFITTIGWVCDLIARWAHIQRNKNIWALDGNFSQHMTGLVLVDELDLHLHPRWQVRVIKDLRRAFPRMSFVVTTHNPLTLLGAKKGEIHVLRRTAGQVVAEQVNLPLGIRTDAVLTGPWFDMGSTLDASTLKLLRTYQHQAAGGASRETLQAHEHTLRMRLGSFADTAEERAAHRLMAELGAVYDAKALSDEERVVLRDRMRAFMETG